MVFLILLLRFYDYDKLWPSLAHFKIFIVETEHIWHILLNASEALKNR